MSTHNTGLGLAETVERRSYANKTQKNASIVRTLFDLFLSSGGIVIGKFSIFKEEQICMFPP